MAKRKLTINCSFAGCSESFRIETRSQQEYNEEAIRNRGWVCNTHRAHLTKRALDGACTSCKLELTPQCPIRTGNGCDLYQPRQ